MMTPSPSLAQAGLGGAGEPMTPELAQQMRWEKELDERNRPLTDEDLDTMFPPTGCVVTVLVFGGWVAFVYYSVLFAERGHG